MNANLILQLSFLFLLLMNITNCTPSSLFFSVISFFITCTLPNQVCSQAVDSNSIYIYDYNNQVRAGLRYMDTEVRFFPNDNEVFTFQNSTIGVSVGGAIGSFSINLGLPIATLNGTINQGSNFDFDLRLFRKRYFWQVSGRRIAGFQTTDPIESFRPEIKLWDFTLFGFKVLDPRLSLKAAFKNSARQKSSSGSFLGGLYVNTQFLKTDSLEISDNTGFSIDSYFQVELGVGIGYAYTWVVSDKWYVTPVLIAGPEFRVLSYGLDGGEFTDQFRIAPRFRGNLAIGYNTSRFYASITAFLLPGLNTRNRLNTRTQDNQVRLRLGYRL
ncbi:MAG: DUF4421 family protein [Bacteroidota bacterium]